MAKEKKAVKKDSLDWLPELEAYKDAWLPLQNVNLEPSMDILRRLASNPMKLLLLEGANSSVRFALALWYVALLNCESEHKPCLECDSCKHIAAKIHYDLFVFDGSVESVKIDDIREILPLLAEKPHYAKKRVIIFSESQNLSHIVLNGLLKVLEDKSDSTLFIFTCSERESMLQTIVSRSIPITLPWEHPKAMDYQTLPKHLANGQAYLDATIDFLVNKKNYFELTKARVSPELVEQIIICLEKHISASYFCLSDDNALAKYFSKKSLNARLEATKLLQNSKRYLYDKVNPNLVLDSLITSLLVDNYN